MVENEAKRREEHDETLLLVRGGFENKDENREYVKKLANAILKCHQNHGIARLRCVGAGALNNATKAFIIANSEAKRNGNELVSSESFTDVKFEHDVIKTGILKEVFKRYIDTEADVSTEDE